MAVGAPKRPREHRVAYRRIVVPLALDDDSDVSISLAAELAAEARASITAVVVIEVPAELPLAAHMKDEEAAAGTGQKFSLSEARRTAADALVVLQIRDTIAADPRLSPWRK